MESDPQQENIDGALMFKAETLERECTCKSGSNRGPLLSICLKLSPQPDCGSDGLGDEGRSLVDSSEAAQLCVVMQNAPLCPHHHGLPCRSLEGCLAAIAVGASHGSNGRPVHVTGLQIRAGGAGMGRQSHRRRDLPPGPHGGLRIHSENHGPIGFPLTSSPSLSFSLTAL
ncbi:hypothetical protein D4764_12G0001400 [Takifugu flavidus]|uniref:Uncharacterized protein n=1 Tax=Takifugu flavidus TaxID=433684 RepID=A0A5C6PEY1_9TELE|nr:hypothetical protein D4764_12G0001400 [Takifugu flavidus]